MMWNLLRVLSIGLIAALTMLTVVQMTQSLYIVAERIEQQTAFMRN